MTKTIRGDYGYDGNANRWANGIQGRAQQDLLAWCPKLQDADSDHKVDFKVNKARARELSWQDPYGTNAMAILRDSIIGKSYKLSLNIDAVALGITEEKAHEWEQRAEKEWLRYAEGAWYGADAARKNTFTFLLHQAITQLHVDGEILATTSATKEGWEGYYTCLNMIEPERLSSPYEAVFPDGIEVRNGVEIDQYGEPLAFYIQRTYPGRKNNGLTDRGSKAVDHVRMPRMTEWGRHSVLHCFDEHRPGMTRGISQMTSVLKQMKMLGAYSDTELERAVMAASFAAVIESDMNWDQAMQVVGASGGSSQFGNALTDASMDHMAKIAPYHQQLGVRYNGSRVAHLLPGEKLNVVQSTVSGAAYDQYEKAMIRQLAAGLGVASESLSRDFSDTSYSAARMSLADIWRSFLVKRAFLNSKFCMPFVGCFLEEAIMKGFLGMPDGSEPSIENWVAKRQFIVRGDFISWQKPVIDPTKERQGQQQALALGLTTMEEEAAAEGKDWDQVLRQRAKEKRLRKELGLNIGDIDPSLSFASPTNLGNEEPKEGAGEGKGGKGGGTAE